LNVATKILVCGTKSDMISITARLKYENIANHSYRLYSILILGLRLGARGWGVCFLLRNFQAL
jgi:hypothetical protein